MLSGGKTLLHLFQARIDNSAVDGYGVKAGDLSSTSDQTPKELKLITAIAAGSPLSTRNQRGRGGEDFYRRTSAVILRSSCDARILPGENGSVLIECSAAWRKYSTHWR